VKEPDVKLGYTLYSLSAGKLFLMFIKKENMQLICDFKLYPCLLKTMATKQKAFVVGI